MQSGWRGTEDRLQAGLADSPTPGQGKATPEGNTIDVDIPGPWGEDNVTSYAAKTDSGEPYVVNVTTRNHTLHSGFVFRMVVSDGRGGFKIVTHGEGNAWKQLLPGAESAAIRAWKENSQNIIVGAR